MNRPVINALVQVDALHEATVLLVGIYMHCGFEHLITARRNCSPRNNAENKKYIYFETKTLQTLQNSVL